VQIQHLPDEGQIVISTIVFFGRGDGEDLIHELIAEFNAYHFLRGGYCLLVDDETQSLYVAQRRPLDSLTGDALAAAVADFAARAQSCTRWYLKETRDRMAAFEAPSPAADLTFAL
jgi:hypothetical protein